MAKPVRVNTVAKGRILFRRAAALSAALLLPISVSAGIVGALAGLFSREDQSQIWNGDNIQNMKLLASVASPLSGISSDLNVLDEGALVAEAGPAPGSAASVRPGSDQISIYVVREGDTLSQIAEMFNVTTNTIRWNNDITGSGIRPGQTLVILPISGVKHVVAKGETLASIAKKYKGDIDEIAGYNGVGKDATLAVGSEIIIPDGEITAPIYSSPSYGAAGLKEYAGYYLRPIAGGKKTQGLHGHNGVDLAGPLGTAIMASADGEVIISRTGGWNGGYGNYIVIRHSNGTQTLYAHNSRNAVSVGEYVKQGQVIGYIGSTGKSTGPHLHFEIRGAKNPF